MLHLKLSCALCVKSIEDSSGKCEATKILARRGRGMERGRAKKEGISEAFYFLLFSVFPFCRCELNFVLYFLWFYESIELALLTEICLFCYC